MRILAAILLAAAVAPWTASQSLRTDGTILVEVLAIDDEHYVTLRADNAPLDQVLTKLTSELGYDLEGFAGARRPALITVDLERRPLEQVLEYALGSVGLSYTLRSGTVTVASGDTAGRERTELLQLASHAYLRALSRHPDHALAAGARLGQGDLAELQGYPGAALDHYQALIADYPRAPEVPAAYMRSGLVLERLGRWADAAVQFRAVANLKLATEFAVSARLELARCTIEIGDAENALFLLSALDANYPPGDAVERGRRALVRALALAGAGRHLEALRTLESVEAMLTGDDHVEGLRVRAIALQGAGNPGDAGRAWLLYALEVPEPTRAYALEQAARLSLEAQDEMGALFIVRQAESLGHAQRFASYKARAYERLGFATEAAARPMGMADRVSEAEARLAAGDAGAASKILSPYLVGASALEPDLRVRFAIAWAGCVAATQSLEPALEHLRAVRAALQNEAHLELRARLDVAAAALLEHREMYDQAADAYRGIY